MSDHVFFIINIMGPSYSYQSASLLPGDPRLLVLCSLTLIEIRRNDRPSNFIRVGRNILSPVKISRVEGQADEGVFKI